MTAEPTGETVAVRTAAGDPVSERCVVADTVRLRLRGLLGHDELPAGEGLWIRPTNSIHMFFMRFAIDAVFLDRDGVVLKIVGALRPWRMASCRGARSVIELSAGQAHERGIQIGDRLEAVERDATAPAL
jgi:uncharacterized protein